MIIEKIYQEGVVPRASHEKLAQVEAVLERRFIRAINRPLRWFAACTVAVEAGYRVAQKRKRQRESHLKALNLVRKALGKPQLEADLENNLVYGYGAYSAVNKDEMQLITLLSLITPKSEQSKAFEFAFPKTRSSCSTAHRPRPKK